MASLVSNFPAIYFTELIFLRLKDKLIKIVVGTDNEVFNVHEGILRASSPFFDKALSGPWKEATQRKIELPEDKPETFALYAYWVYCKTLPLEITAKSVDDAIMDMEYIKLCHAYALGDKLLAPNFQNTVMNAIVEGTNILRADGQYYSPSKSVIRSAYDITLKGSLLRHFLVDEWSECPEAKWFGPQETENLPHAFLEDLVEKLIHLRNDNPQAREAPKYHLPVQQ